MEIPMAPTAPIAPIAPFKPDTDLPVLPTDDFYIIVQGGEYIKTAILQNKYIGREHMHYKHCMKKNLILPKGTVLSTYTTKCIGAFKTVFEAKLYIKLERRAVLLKLLQGLPKTGIDTDRSRTTVGEQEKAYKGEVKKIVWWCDKHAEKYPEYFI